MCGDGFFFPLKIRAFYAQTLGSNRPLIFFFFLLRGYFLKLQSVSEKIKKKI